MRVYIPFDDGSSVAFDGVNFTLHRRPMDIDEDLTAPPDSKAARVWEKDWETVVRALESAWRRQRDKTRHVRARRIYSPEPGEEGGGRRG